MDVDIKDTTNDKQKEILINNENKWININDEYYKKHHNVNNLKELVKKNLCAFNNPQKRKLECELEEEEEDEFVIDKTKNDMLDIINENERELEKLTEYGDIREYLAEEDNEISLELEKMDLKRSTFEVKKSIYDENGKLIEEFVEWIQSQEEYSSHNNIELVLKKDLDINLFFKKSPYNITMILEFK